MLAEVVEFQKGSSKSYSRILLFCKRTESSAGSQELEEAASSHCLRCYFLVIDPASCS